MKKKVTLFVVFTSFLLGFVSPSYASEGKSSIKFYLENVIPEDEEVISDSEESGVENLPQTDTSGSSESKLPQTDFSQSKVMITTGSLLLVFVLLIIKERRNKNEKI